MRHLILFFEVEILPYILDLNYKLRRCNREVEADLESSFEEGPIKLEAFEAC